MSNSIETEFAYAYGKQFAQEVNAGPDRANWSVLGKTDDLPEFDYSALKSLFGDVTPEIEIAYKTGFNENFVPEEEADHETNI